MTPGSPSPQVLAILGRLVEERAGLHYRTEDLPLLGEKIAPRALDAGFDSLLDYYYFLRYDPDGATELDTLVTSLLVHETYFFREADALRVIAADLVPAIVDHRPRVWCAACATGEEPLTLAMLLADRGALGQIDLLASDLSLRALDRAQRGKHGPRSVRALPEGVLDRWLHRDGNDVRVEATLRDAIDWRRVNLVDPTAVTALGTFDVILCRNVLIYFSDETVRRVVASLTDALRPGGHLVVGASESLLRLGTGLRCEERGGAFFYARAS